MSDPRPSARDAVLQNIRAALRDRPGAGEPLPPVAEVWPRSNPGADALAARFAEELAAVHGETIFCRSLEEAGAQLQRLMDECGWQQIAALDRPLVAELAAALPAGRIRGLEPQWAPAEMAEIPAGLLAAEKLLADTGSCVVACHTAQERMLCYLPPVSIVVARREQLAEHLPAAFDESADWCADPQRCGELVIITGPSRTADIEKILILGVHGPKRLVVLLVD